MCLVGTPVPLPAGHLEAASAAIDAANSMEHALQLIATTPPTMSDSAALPSGLLSLPTGYINPNGPVVTRTVGSDSTGGVGFFFRQHICALDVNGRVVETQLDRVRDRFRPTAEDLVPFFASPEHAPETRMRGLAHAFEASSPPPRCPRPPTTGTVTTSGRRWRSAGSRPTAPAATTTPIAP
ncbi:hypothetical protein [Streptomyces sp. NPDC056540]|uniref:hypothetical protein n=1 Tax=Streptomyces sp. NPDC056540 TaxID=3345859 RepID=UPI0036C363B6